MWRWCRRYTSDFLFVWMFVYLRPDSALSIGGVPTFDGRRWAWARDGVWVRSQLCDWQSHKICARSQRLQFLESLKLYRRYSVIFLVRFDEKLRLVMLYALRLLSFVSFLLWLGFQMHAYPKRHEGEKTNINELKRLLRDKVVCAVNTYGPSGILMETMANYPGCHRPTKISRCGYWGCSKERRTERKIFGIIWIQIFAQQGF